MKELAEKAIHGDVDAFLELMDRNSLSMYKVARGILNQDDDVADAIQDTILKCFEKIRTLKNPEYFKTWMIRILINECNQILRHYQRVRLPGEFQEAGDNPDAFTVVLDANGEKLENGTFGGACNMLSVSGRDVSKAEVYICDYEEYMDELKGYWYSEEKSSEKSFQEILEERALYHKQIIF